MTASFPERRSREEVQEEDVRGGPQRSRGSRSAKEVTRRGPEGGRERWFQRSRESRSQEQVARGGRERMS